MPGQFLDLSDDIILNISQYLPGNQDVPLPSFTPHWENYDSEIRGEVGSSQRNLRMTCRRLRHVLRKEEWHLVVRRWTQLEKWMQSASPDLCRTVRRVRLDMKHDGKSIDAGGKWTIITDFLQTLPRLEELIIASIPICSHGLSEPSSSPDLRFPDVSYLPVLQSLSVEVKCAHCAVSLPKVFVPAAPRLRHLKVSSNTSALSADVDSGHFLDSLRTAWSDSNERREMPLETLYVRTANPSMTCFPLWKAAAKFPELRKLVVTPYKYDGKQYRSPYQLCDDVNLYATSYPNRWEFTPNVADLGEIDMDDLLDHLKDFKSLQYIDCFFTVNPGSHRPFKPMPQKGFTRSEYKRHHEEKLDIGWMLNSHSAYETQLKSAMRAFAQAFIGAIPTLQGGVLWEARELEVDLTSHNKFTWSTNVTRSGRRTAKVDNEYETITDDFASNEDGARNAAGDANLI
ncbi:hypothetical protein CI109_104162 [Kwoniella shandongensis]|uniref:Uncharacterized protein n=1 Tax=Kwoniella shandongensis TaxID=1734106 RepID=A0A5M6C0V0_9TREE|nr:uncharacterized protein CI109_002925 [Kwoniella shandongensis]KAA5528767.1 hypothetical protein CI109_002925 [Kwoniella shandongensis]